MSDQPTSNPPGIRTGVTSGIQAALRDVRWLSGLVWAGLLGALLVTSIYGIEAFTQGSIATRYFALPTNATVADSGHALAIGGIVASGLAAAAIVMAWWQFAQATRSLIVAYGAEDGDMEAAPIAAEWITEAPAPAGDGSRTRIAVADILLWVGAAWAVLILTPAFLNLVASFSTKAAPGFS